MKLFLDTTIPNHDRVFSEIEQLEGQYDISIKKIGDVRSYKQNRALHLWFEQIAQLFNDKHFYCNPLFEIEIRWNKDMVKYNLFKPLMIAWTKKESTTQLTKKELDAVVEYLQKFISDNVKEFVPFPSVDEMFNKML